jgi:hypothetical protein
MYGIEVVEVQSMWVQERAIIVYGDGRTHVLHHSGLEMIWFSAIVLWIWYIFCRLRRKCCLLKHVSGSGAAWHVMGTSVDTFWNVSLCTHCCVRMEKWKSFIMRDTREFKEATKLVARSFVAVTGCVSLSKPANPNAWPIAGRKDAIPPRWAHSNHGRFIESSSFSSYWSLVRVTAWVLRLVRHARRRRTSSGEMDASELMEAHTYWIREV